MAITLIGRRRQRPMAGAPPAEAQPVPPTAVVLAAPPADAAAAAPPAPKKKRELLPRWMKPWKLPLELEAKGDLTVQELAEEARADAPLTRAWGWKDSAALHPQRMGIQYLRLMQFLGWFGLKPYFMYGLFVLIGTLAMTVVMSLMIYSAEQGQEGRGYQSTAELPVWLGSVMGAVIGLVATVPGGAVMLSTSRFWAAYSSSTVVLGSGGATRRVCRTPLLRMAFADSKEPVHIGAQGRSGFAKGRMLLRSKLDFHEVSTVIAFYAAEVARSTFTGTQATLYNALVRTQLEAGRIVRERSERNRKKGVKWDAIGNFGVTLLLAAIGYAALVSFSGVDPTEAANLAEHLPYAGNGGK